MVLLASFIKLEIKLPIKQITCGRLDHSIVVSETESKI